MAKPTDKRKSEGDLPARQSKLRKTSLVTSSENSHAEHTGTEDTVDDGLFVKEHAAVPKRAKQVKTRKSEPARLTRDDECEGDQGRLESLQFLALVDFKKEEKRLAAKAASAYLGQFKQAVKEDEMVLKKRLQELSTNTSKQETEFVQSFTDAFITSRPKGPPKEPSKEVNSFSNRVFSSFYEKSRKLTEEALKLVETFEKINDKTSEKDLVKADNDWVVDDEHTANILGIGYKVGIEKIESILTASEPPAIDADVVASVERFYGSEDKGLAAAWGLIAKKQEKATKKLTKTFALEMA